MTIGCSSVKVIKRLKRKAFLQSQTLLPMLAILAVPALSSSIRIAMHAHRESFSTAEDGTTSFSLVLRPPSQDVCDRTRGGPGG